MEPLLILTFFFILAGSAATAFAESTEVSQKRRQMDVLAKYFQNFSYRLNRAENSQEMAHVQNMVEAFQHLPVLEGFESDKNLLLSEMREQYINKASKMRLTLIPSIN